MTSDFETGQRFSAISKYVRWACVDRRSILCKKPRTIIYKKSRLNVSLNRIEKCCSNPINRSTKNVLDEVNLQVTGKYAVLISYPTYKTRRIYCVCRRAWWLMTTYNVRKSIKLHAIYVTFGNLESEIIVVLFKVIWNIKFAVCRALHNAHCLKLTRIDSNLNPVWKRIRFERALNCIQIRDFWKHPMSRIWNNCVFIQGNLKYKLTWRTYNSVRRAPWLMTHSRLKLTWIDSRFNPVWKLIPFERALNATQYMLIWQHSYIQHRRKLYFYIENYLIKKKQLMNMICSCRGAIRSFVWID